MWVDPSMSLFKLVAVGGTFDELHKGHRTLLLKAFEVGERVLIGLCTDDFANLLRKNHGIAPYHERLRELRKFLKDHQLLGRAEVFPLEDPYGPTVCSNEIEAIVVSRETEPRAHEINKIRESKGLKPLEILTIEMVPAEDRVPISTTRIYRGEIDREGRLLRTVSPRKL